MKILLIHQYAGNKGDRAVAFAMCLLLKKVAPEVEITISTSSPELWKNITFFEHNKIKFIPTSWDFEHVEKNRAYWALLNKFKKYTFTIHRECYILSGRDGLCRFLINPSFYKALKVSDLVISVGGHHFTTLLSRDLVSTINYDAMSVLSLGKKLSCFSQTFGPFEFYNKRNLLLTQKILSSCEALYVREKSSIKSLNQLHIPNDAIHEVQESVIYLNVLFNSYVLPSKREKKIGIAIYATQKRSHEIMEQYIRAIAGSVKHFIQKGFQIVFFPMELKNSGPDDRPLIREIMQIVGADKESCGYIDVDMNTELHLYEVSKCQLFIGHKTHSTIFALTSGTPLVGIAYHPKTREFMKQFDVEDYCIDDENLTAEILIRKVERLLENMDAIGEYTFQRARKCKTQLERGMSSLVNVLK